MSQHSWAAQMSEHNEANYVISMPDKSVTASLAPCHCHCRSGDSSSIGPSFLKFKNSQVVILNFEKVKGSKNIFFFLQMWHGSWGEDLHKSLTYPGPSSNSISSGSCFFFWSKETCILKSAKPKKNNKHNPNRRT